MTGTYIPNARESIGASDMPNGQRYYEALVRQFTTLDLSPPQIHEIGLKEVARIRAEMQQVINTLEFDGTFADFVHYLRTDPSFYAETPGELLDYAMVISKRMDGALPALFQNAAAYALYRRAGAGPPGPQIHGWPLRPHFDR